MSAVQDMARVEGLEYALANWYARKCNGLLEPKPQGLCKEHDFRVFVPNGIEVKSDEKCEETGNVFLECHNSRLNEPSGLAATKALHWLHYLPHLNQVLVFKPAEMLNWLVGSGHRYLVGVGDNNANGYLVALEDVRALKFVKTYPVNL